MHPNASPLPAGRVPPPSSLLGLTAGSGGPNPLTLTATDDDISAGSPRAWCSPWGNHRRFAQPPSPRRGCYQPAFAEKESADPGSAGGAGLGTRHRPPLNLPTQWPLLLTSLLRGATWGKPRGLWCLSFPRWAVGGVGLSCLCCYVFLLRGRVDKDRQGPRECWEVFGGEQGCLPTSSRSWGFSWVQVLENLGCLL